MTAAASRSAAVGTGGPTTSASSFFAAACAAASTIGCRSRAVGAGGPTKATFGRDASCDFVIEHQRTSRSHAVVELRFDKFFIVDHSSNGTWVSIGNESPMVLRREELILRGSGVLTFGRTPDDAEAARVEFVLL